MRPRVRWPLLAAAVVLSGTSVGALLAEVYGVADMATVGRFATLPGLAVLILIGATRVVSGDEGEEFRRRLRVGAVAGLIGTLGYDVFRLPFAAAGYRLFAPIDSYGLFLVDATMSSPVSDTVGWLFHLSNGVTFGTAYVLVAARRHWGWGVLWGLALEAAVVLSPFRERYALDDWFAIGIAFAAHVPFGLAVGRMGQRLDALDDSLRTSLRRPALYTIAAAVVAIVVWQQPWNESGDRAAAGRLAAERGLPAVVVRSDQFTPEWLRVERGGCVAVDNRGDERFDTPYGLVAPRSVSELCFEERGVVRVKLGPEPYSGGFVDVQ